MKRISTEGLGANDTLVVEHNEIAGAKKTIPMIGYLEFLGSASAGIETERGAILSLFNAAATVGFVALATTADPMPAAPAAPGANILQLKPNDYTTICLGPNSKIKSSANITAYTLIDHSKLTRE